MQALIIKATENSPGIHFDSNTQKFEVYGESRMENTGKFFEPAIKWLENFNAFALQQLSHEQFIFNFRFEYFNSIAAKYVFQMLSRINDMHLNKLTVTINWYYDEQDRDMRDAGEEFSKLIEASFNFIPSSSSSWQQLQ